MNMLSLVLDISTAVVVILITATSIKRSLIASIIEFVGGIAAAVAASFVGWLTATWVYNMSIKGIIINSVSSIVSLDGGLTSENIFNVLPKPIQNLLTQSGVNASNIFGTFVTGDAQTIAESVEQGVASYMISYIAKICTVIFFTFFMVLLIALVSRFSKHFSNSYLKAVDNVLSAVFGLIKSAFIIMVLIILIDAIVLTLGTDAYAVFSSAVESSMLFKLLYAVNVPTLIISAVVGV